MPTVSIFIRTAESDVRKTEARPEEKQLKAESRATEPGNNV